MEVSNEDLEQSRNRLRRLREKVDARTTTEVAQAVRLLLAMAASDSDDWFHRLDLTWIDDADLLPALEAAIETSARRHVALQAFAEDCRAAIAHHRGIADEDPM